MNMVNPHIIFKKKYKKWFVKWFVKWLVMIETGLRPVSIF